jgi:sugar fermentation stimulation protein A
MKFQKKLYEGILLDRYKRFFADVELNDESGVEKLTIHVPNTGSLKGIIDKKATSPQKCWFSLHGDDSKKLKGTLEAVRTLDGSWVGVNTSNPNKIVNEAALASIKSETPFLPHWAGYTFYKPEFKINEKSRLDGAFLKSESDLQNPDSKKHFIEIKNTTYKSLIDGKSFAQFPDSVTERGQKHIEEMMLLMEQGHTCELIFAVQRSDVKYFSAAEQFDPVYAKLLGQAQKKGLIISPLICQISQTEVSLTNQLLIFK